MNKCPKCDYSVPSGARYCPSCGCNVTNPNDFNDKINEFGDKLKSLNETDDFSYRFTDDDIRTSKNVAALSYLGILVLIPLLTMPDSKFAKFHVNQGLILCIAHAAALFLNFLLGFVFIIGWLVMSVIGIALFTLVVLGLINAFTGKAKELPVIGGFRIIDS
ncbi:MAG: hypothetical protein FWH05_02215 [Oscillospiraceae bacterium]|nr:hypothetical protein [Oscillospiraceae bacterium]